MIQPEGGKTPPQRLARDRAFPETQECPISAHILPGLEASQAPATRHQEVPEADEAWVEGRVRGGRRGPLCRRRTSGDADATMQLAVRCSWGTLLQPVAGEKEAEPETDDAEEIKALAPEVAKTAPGKPVGPAATR